MGSWVGTCVLSSLPIFEWNEVVAILMVELKHNPLFTLTAKGIYDGYGRIDVKDETVIAEAITNHVKQCCSSLPEDRYGLTGIKTLDDLNIDSIIHCAERSSVFDEISLMVRPYKYDEEFALPLRLCLAHEEVYNAVKACGRYTIEDVFAPSDDWLRKDDRGEFWRLLGSSAMEFRWADLLYSATKDITDEESLKTLESRIIETSLFESGLKETRHELYVSSSGSQQYSMKEYGDVLRAKTRMHEELMGQLQERDLL